MAEDRSAKFGYTSGDQVTMTGPHDPDKLRDLGSSPVGDDEESDDPTHDRVMELAEVVKAAVEMATPLQQGDDEGAQKLGQVARLLKQASGILTELDAGMEGAREDRATGAAAASSKAALAKAIASRRASGA